MTFVGPCFYMEYSNSPTNPTIIVPHLVAMWTCSPLSPNIFGQLNWKALQNQTLIKLTETWITFTVIKDGNVVRLQWKLIKNYNNDVAELRVPITKFEILEKIVYAHSRYMDLLLFYVRNEFLSIHNSKIQ